MKKFLQSVAATMALIMVFTLLPVMPVDEAEASTGNSRGTTVSKSEGSSYYPYTNPAAMPMIIVQPYNFMPLKDRLPSAEETAAIINATKKDSDPVADVEGSMSPWYTGKAITVKDSSYETSAYASILAQVQSAREQVLYYTPKLDPKSCLIFSSMATTKWTTFTRPGESWFKNMGLGYFDGDNVGTSEQRAKIADGDKYRNSVVYAGIKEGKSGDYYSALTDDRFRNKNSGTAYTYMKGLKLSDVGGSGSNTILSSTTGGVFVDELLKAGLIIYDKDEDMFRFNENFDVKKIDEIVIGTTDKKLDSATQYGNKWRQAKTVWTFITDLFPTSSSKEASSYGSDIGERIDGYILNGMLTLSGLSKDTLKTYITGAPDRIGELNINNKRTDYINNRVKAFNLGKYEEAAYQGAGRAATYFCNPVYSLDNVTISTGTEKNLAKLASGTITLDDLKASAGADSAIYKTLKVVDTQYNGDYEKAVTDYCENVALYDLYYLDLMMQLYAIAAANDPVSTQNPNSTWHHSISVDQWRTACKDFVTEICGQSGYPYRESGDGDNERVDKSKHVSDPSKYGFAIMTGVVSQGTDGTNTSRVVIASANDLVLAENNLLQIEDAVESVNYQDNPDAYAINKRYCGYALSLVENNPNYYAKNVKDYNSPIIDLLQIQNTEVRAAIMEYESSSDDKKTWEWFTGKVNTLNDTAASSKGFLKRLVVAVKDLVEERNGDTSGTTKNPSATQNFYETMYVYKQYNERFANALNNAYAKNTGSVHSYGESGSKTWWGYISGRYAFPMTYEVSKKDGIKTHNGNTLKTEYNSYDRVWLAMVGQYATTRGFYELASTRYDPKFTVENGMGQIGAIYAIPLAPIGPAAPNSHPDNAAIDPDLYAVIDIVSAMTVTADDDMLSRDETLLVSDGKGGPVEKESRKVINVSAEDKRHIRMASNAGKMYSTGSGHFSKWTSFSTDDKGTDLIWSSKKLGSVEQLSKGAGKTLTRISSYWNAYKFQKKTSKKPAGMVLKDPNTGEKDEANSLFARKVDYGLLLENTWRHVTQSLSPEKEGTTYYGANYVDADKTCKPYTTADPVAIAVRIPDYDLPYKNEKGEDKVMQNCIASWMEECAYKRDGEKLVYNKEFKVSVSLYDAEGNKLTSDNSSLVGSDGYAIWNGKSDTKAKTYSGAALTEDEFKTLLNNIKEGKPILTLKADTKTESKNCTVDSGDSDEVYCSYTAVITMTGIHQNDAKEVGKISTATHNQAKDDKGARNTSELSDPASNLPNMLAGKNDAGKLTSANVESKPGTDDRQKYTVYDYTKQPEKKGDLIVYPTKKVNGDNRCNIVEITYDYKGTKASPTGDNPPEAEVYVHFQTVEKINDTWVWQNKNEDILAYYEKESYDVLGKDDFGKKYVLDVKTAAGGEMPDLDYDSKTGKIYLGEGTANENGLDARYYITDVVAPEIIYRNAKVAGDYVCGSENSKDGDGRITDISTTSAYVYQTGSNIPKDKLDGGRIDIYIPVKKDPTPTWDVYVYYVVEETKIFQTSKLGLQLGVGYHFDADSEYEYEGRIYYYDEGTSYAEFKAEKGNTFTSYPLTVDETLRHSVNSPSEAGVVKIYIPFVRPVEDYVYHSYPEAYAELKNADKSASVDRNDTSRADPNYQELFEAMAGVPSTELLYFSVGGSEFLVEFRAELEKEVIERTYCSHINGTDCEFKVADTLAGMKGIEGKQTQTTEYVTVKKDGEKANDKTSTIATNTTVSATTHSKGTQVTEWYNVPEAKKSSDSDSVLTNTFKNVSAHGGDKFSITWTGKIENMDGSKKPSDETKAVGYDLGPGEHGEEASGRAGCEESSTSKSTALAGEYGEPGAMGTERNSDFEWHVDAFNEDLNYAVEWAKAMEKISNEDGQIIKLADSDGITRSWHSGKATITIKFANISNKGQADEQKNTQENGELFGNETQTFTTDSPFAALEKKNDARLGTTWREDYGEKAVRGASSGCYGSCYDLKQYEAQTEKSKEYTYTHTVTGDDTANNKAGTVKAEKKKFTYRDPLAAAITGGRVCGKTGYTGAENAASPAWTGCSLTPHTHGKQCEDENGVIDCGMDEHTHGEGNCNAKRETPAVTTHAVHTCTHTCGSWKPMVRTYAKKMADVTYTITITFDNPYTMSDSTRDYAVTARDERLCPANTLPEHALCGPCCSHTLTAIEDTWTQRAEIWSVRITDLNVMMLDEGYSDGMTEIRTGSTSISDADDVVEALIIQGQPNVFYNIAASMNGMKKVKSNDGQYTGLVVKDGSVSGRLRYSLQTAQDDNVYWEEYINSSLHRNNWCDGTQGTLTGYNPAPDGGRGHEEPWATGALYSNSSFINEVDRHKNHNYGNLTGYSNYYSDNLTRLTAEWKRFDQRRRLPVSMTVISDFLILQTSSGDQPIMYYEKTVSATAQENLPSVKWNTSPQAWADMVTGNPNCIKSQTLNRGGYNGRYDLASVKYRGSGGGARLSTAFDTDPNEYGKFREQDELGLAKVTGNYMYNNGNYYVTGTGHQTGNKANGEAGSASQNNKTSGITQSTSSSRYWHHDTSIKRLYYAGNADADVTSATKDSISKARCSGDSTYTEYNTGASYNASIFHSSSPCFGQYRLSRPTEGLRLTEIVKQCITNSNKEYIPGQSHAVWHPIIDVSYATDKTAVDDYTKDYESEEIKVVNPITGNTLLKLNGWQMDAIYARGKTSVNSIVVHDPVSVELAFVVSQDKALDQRVNPDTRTAAINEALSKLGECTHDAETCEHRYLDCKYYKAAGSNVNLCETCKGECAWKEGKTCSTCGNTGKGKCFLCKGTGIQDGGACPICGGDGRTFHVEACFSKQFIHESVTTDYYNGITADSAPAKAYSIPGIKVKEMGGKTWARVLWQDVSANTNYFTTGDRYDSNKEGKFSALGKIDQIKYGDGYEFMLDYPDSYGPYAGAYHEWYQSANPFDAGNTSGANVAGYICYHNDFINGYGAGIQLGTGSAVLDGSCNSNDWWLCAGIMDGSFTGPSGTDTKQYAMPGPAGPAGYQRCSQVELWLRVDPASYDGVVMVTSDIDWAGNKNDGSYQIKSDKNTHTITGSCFTGKSSGYITAYYKAISGDTSDLKKMLGDALFEKARTTLNFGSEGHVHSQSCYELKTDINKYLTNENFSALMSANITGTIPEGSQIVISLAGAGGNTLSGLKLTTNKGEKALKDAITEGIVGAVMIEGVADENAVKSGDPANFAKATIRFTVLKGNGLSKVTFKTTGSGKANVTAERTYWSLKCTKAETAGAGTHLCFECDGTGVTTSDASPLKAGTVFDFSYEGGYRKVTLPAGTYRLEAWGAQGGSNGGKGGYTDGVATFTEPTDVYIYVGGSGDNGGFNGGEAGSSVGGGATDFRLVSGDTLAALQSRFMVAGGGGAAGGAGGGFTAAGASGVSGGSQVSGGSARNARTSEGGIYVNNGLTGSFGSYYKLGKAITFDYDTCTYKYIGTGAGWNNHTRVTVGAGSGNSGIEFTHNVKAQEGEPDLLEIGKDYLITVTAFSSAGGDSIKVGGGVTVTEGASSYKLSSNNEDFTFIVRATGKTFSILTSGKTNSTVWLDNMTITEITSVGRTAQGGGGGGGWYSGGSGSKDQNGAGGSSYIKGIPGYSTQYTAAQGNVTFAKGSSFTGQQAGDGHARITVLSILGSESACSHCHGSGTIKGTAGPSIDQLTTFVKSNINSVPLKVGGIVNPIWDCGLHGDKCTKHVCNGNCNYVYTLTCSEPHHEGNHGGYGDGCYSPCNNDTLHQRTASQDLLAGRAVEIGDFILLDNYFDVYFANIGNFYETNDYGLYDTQVPKGIGYTSPMDTSKWTREKLIKFPYPVLYERFDGEWEEYKAGDWIELEVRDNNGVGIVNYHFYAPLYGNEMAAGTVEYAVEAINTTWEVLPTDNAYWKDWQNYSFRNPGKYWLDKAYVRDNEYSNKYQDDCPLTGKVVTNAQRHADLTAYHTVWKQNAIDVVGRIGNILIDDTDDMRYANLFKKSVGDGWLVEGYIHEVDTTQPYGYMSWHYNKGGLALDIRGLQLAEKNGAAYIDQLENGLTESSADYRNQYSSTKKVSTAYDYYNTYGMLDWTEEHAGVYDAAMPVASSNNRDRDLNPFTGLQDNELKLGYGFLWDIQTIGCYENGILDVKPYIYALNSETGELVPADIWFGDDTEGYSAVNIFGLEDMDKTSAEYQNLSAKVAKYYQYFEFNKYRLRHNISDEEWNNTLLAASCASEFVYDESGDIVTTRKLVSGDQLQIGYDADGNQIWVLAPRPSAYNAETGETYDEVVESPLMREAVIPAGDYINIGTMQHLTADGHARTYIGSSDVYAAVIDKEVICIDLTAYDDVRYTGDASGAMQIEQNPDVNTNLLGTPEEYYAVHGQRWHLTSKLPSSTVVTLYRDGKHVEPLDYVTVNGKSVQARDEMKTLGGKWILLVTADITCDGMVYSLHYSQGDNNGVITTVGKTYEFKDGAASSAVQHGSSQGNVFTVPTLLAVYEAQESNEVDYQIQQTH